jgi:hypothetical protein
MIVTKPRTDDDDDKENDDTNDMIKNKRRTRKAMAIPTGVFVLLDRRKFGEQNNPPK